MWPKEFMVVGLELLDEEAPGGGGPILWPRQLMAEVGHARDRARVAHGVGS